MILPIPSQEVIAQSVRREWVKHDSFYKLPKIIECFIDRANNELPRKYRAIPWTINRAVSIFKTGEKTPILVIGYEQIEDDIVWWLDYLQTKCT